MTTAANLDNPLYAGAGAAYSAAYFDCQPSIDGDDLLEELYDVRGLIALLAKQGRAETIGKIVVAITDAFAARLADIHLGTKTTDAVYAAEAAAAVIAMEVTNG